MRTGLKRRMLAVVTALVLVVGLATADGVTHEDPATAAVGSAFNPGMIISDAVFYDSGTMTATQIQSFLNAKVPTCRSGYVCLKSYRQTTTSQPARSEGCAAYTGQSNELASQIIYKVARACGINPRSLLVLLEKEQALITDTWPTSRQYRSATGYGCPDTADCDANYYGFFNQLYNAAWQFKKYRARPADRAYQAGRYNTIAWHPNSACGSSRVYIQNQATAGLYLYTPYRPNAAALANLYGTGDSCSSYGNRNFWRMFTDWFGSTSAPAQVDVAMDAIPLAYTRDRVGDLWLYPGTGTGAWKSSVRIGVGWGSLKQVVGAGDLDGDGHRDIMAIDSAGSLWNYPTNGRGRFGTKSKIGDGFAGVTALVAAGDFNSDGAVDFFTRASNGDLRLHAGNGLGQFAPAKRVGVGWSGLTAIIGGVDFDGDGLTDVLGRFSNGDLRLYPGNGRSGWKSSRLIGVGWSSFTGLFTPGDFDGDKVADVLARDAAGGLWLYPGNGAGGWKTKRKVGSGWSELTVLSGPGSVAKGAFTPVGGMGDLSGDGPADLMVRTGDGAGWIYPGNAVGGFLTRTKFSSAWNWPTAVVAAGDLDRNGRRDVLVRESSGVLWRYPSNGAGGFSTRVSLGAGWAGYTALAGGVDLNGDRKLDLLARTASGDLVLHKGDGTGAFPTRATVGPGWQAMRWILTPGDVNRDGRADVIAVNADGDLLLYRGNGVGGFAAAVQVGHGWSGMTWVMTPGDFDGDRIPDLIARTSTGNVMLYPGNGSSGWKPAKQIATGWQRATFIG